MLQGKEHDRGAEAVPGDICAIAKVDEIHFDAVLHDSHEDDHIHLKPLDFPAPVHGLAIEPKRRGDEQRLRDILHKLVDEDPCLRIEHDAATNETVIYGLGELHLRMLLERMSEALRLRGRRRGRRAIAYRETITAPGRRPPPPQEADRRRRPVRRGVPARRAAARAAAGFEFVDEVKGGAIPGQFIPAVEKGVRQVLADGALAGYPAAGRARHRLRRQAPRGRLEGGRVRLRRAARRSSMRCRRRSPIVLEPIVRRGDHRARASAIGDITGDLATKRAPHQRQRHALPGQRATVIGAGAARRDLRVPVAPQGAHRRPGRATPWSSATTSRCRRASSRSWRRPGARAPTRSSAARLRRLS